MTTVAALEYGEQNIRVDSVAPGAIDTQMIREATDEVGVTVDEFAPHLSLLNRFSRPNEIAQASLWLASVQSLYLTETTIHADSGYTSR